MLGIEPMTAGMNRVLPKPILLLPAPFAGDKTRFLPCGSRTRFSLVKSQVPPWLRIEPFAVRVFRKRVTAARSADKEPSLVLRILPVAHKALLSESKSEKCCCKRLLIQSTIAGNDFESYA